MYGAFWSWRGAMVAGLQDVSQRAPGSMMALLAPLRQTGLSGRHGVAATAIVLALAACSTIDDLFDSSTPAPSSKSGSYPNLQSVPNRPDRPTPPAGLSGDRSNARYTDGDVKPVNEAADAVVGQKLSASAPPPPANVASAQPTAPVAPGNAVQSAPVTPSAAPATPNAPVTPSAAPATPNAPPAAATPTTPPPAANAQPMAAPPMAAPPVMMSGGMPAPIPPSATQLILPSPTGSRAGAPLPRAPGAVASPSYVPVTGNLLEIAIVQFGRSSAGLDGVSINVLRDVASIQRSQGGVLRIIGHASADTTNADPQRAKEDSYGISLSRANAIARQLAALGVPRDQIVVEAAADDQPQYAPDTAVAVAANRRAEIYLDL